MLFSQHLKPTNLSPFASTKTKKYCNANLLLLPVSFVVWSFHRNSNMALLITHVFVCACACKLLRVLLCVRACEEAKRQNFCQTTKHTKHLHLCCFTYHLHTHCWRAHSSTGGLVRVRVHAPRGKSGMSRTQGV